MWNDKKTFAENLQEQVTAFNVLSARLTTVEELSFEDVQDISVQLNNIVSIFRA